MMVTMLVTLYTSRVILNALGVNDFGIYNVVGGFVALFSFISNSMAHASLRFFAYEIGRNNLDKLRQTFRLTLSIYIIFSIIILILGETIGLWFVSNKLNIPSDRQLATLWVYQFSLFAFIATIVRIPFNSVIIARENMKFYAWTSIIETGLKLGIVFILLWLQFDKLILYSILTFGIVLIITFIYFIYCKKSFPECIFRLAWDKHLFLTMFSFAGWSFFDSIAFTAMNQGVNILINIFFGTAINAARGIAFQVSTQVASFVYSYQTAAAPQITKYFALDQKEEMKKLFFQSSKFSYFLLFIFALPAIFEVDSLLKIWLNHVPDYTAIFTRLVLITILVDSLSGTINDVAKATGRIKYFNLLVSITLLLNLPISYILLKLDYPPQATIFTSMVISFAALFVRLVALRHLISFKISEYIKKVVVKNIIVSLASIPIPLLIYLNFNQSVLSFFAVTFTCVITVLTSIFLFGLSVNEKRIVISYIDNRFGISKYLTQE